jgi:ferric-dicitrate binding protein FerR (iron transport regulator)
MARAGLVSGIQAKVNNPARAKATAIIVAVLTFLGALTNTAEGHYVAEKLDTAFGQARGVRLGPWLSGIPSATIIRNIH